MAGKRLNSALSIILLGFLAGCISKSPYEQLVADELAKGIRQDSLFHGIYFQMERKAFQERSHQLNREGVFTDGEAAKVRFKILELPDTATFLFYPDFLEDKIYQVQALAEYDAWAPWNKSQNAQALCRDLRGLMLKWYGGNDFIKVESDDKPTLWVKVDGNRRITLAEDDDARVKIFFRDLTYQGDK